MANARGWANIEQAFRNRQYRTYQAGRFLFLITTWMYKVAVGWLVWDLTHSATWLGVFGFLDQAPALLVMPLAGAQADRMDSLKYMRVTQALLLIQALVLSLLVIFDLVTIWILVAFTLLYGSVNAAQQPASQAILPNLVRKDDLPVAYGLNSLTFNVSRFIGGMIAGPVIVLWGTGPAILFNVLGAAWFSFCLIVMQNEFSIPIRPRHKESHMLGQIREGLSYAMDHPGIGPTIVILSILSVLPFSIDLLLPGLADGVYHAGANGLAWMTSIMGLGAVGQAIFIARRGAITGLTAYVIRAILVMAGAFVALALSGWIGFALVCIFAIGFTTSSVRVGSMTLLQYSVDGEMRGRVASFYGLINHAGPAVGSLVIGVLGDLFGIPLMMGVVGLVTLAVWAWALRRRDIMAKALEGDPRATAEEEAAPGGR